MTTKYEVVRRVVPENLLSQFDLLTKIALALSYDSLGNQTGTTSSHTALSLNPHGLLLSRIYQQAVISCDLAGCHEELSQHKLHTAKATFDA